MINLTISAFCTIFVCALGISAISTIPPSIPEPTADTDLDKSMETMHAEMQKVRYSGNADADFASLMIPHHQGAIEMSKVDCNLARILASAVSLRKLSSLSNPRSRS